MSMSSFASVPLSELPLRTLREVSSMAKEVLDALSAQPPDHRRAFETVVSSPRTPYLGAFLVVLALCLLALE